MLPPITKSIEVHWSPEAAFRRFTEEMGTWWPLRTHTVHGGRSDTVVFEPRVGGKIFERTPQGEVAVWGTVEEWDPPRAVAFSWHPGRPAAQATRVAVRFESDGERTRVTLEHSQWEALGSQAAVARRSYPLGWAYTLRLWAGRRHSPVVWLVDALTAVVLPLQRRLSRRTPTAAAS